MSIATRPVPSIQSLSATSFTARFRSMPLAVPFMATRPVLASAEAVASTAPFQILPCNVVTLSRPLSSVASSRNGDTR